MVWSVPCHLCMVNVGIEVRMVYLVGNQNSCTHSKDSLILYYVICKPQNGTLILYHVSRFVSAIACCKSQLCQYQF